MRPTKEGVKTDRKHRGKPWLRVRLAKATEQPPLKTKDFQTLAKTKIEAKNNAAAQALSQPEKLPQKARTQNRPEKQVRAQQPPQKS